LQIPLGGFVISFTLRVGQNRLGPSSTIFWIGCSDIRECPPRRRALRVGYHLRPHVARLVQVSLDEAFAARRRDRLAVSDSNSR